jgi:hypothetical protein
MLSKTISVLSDIVSAIHWSLLVVSLRIIYVPLPLLEEIHKPLGGGTFREFLATLRPLAFVTFFAMFFVGLPLIPKKRTAGPRTLAILVIVAIAIDYIILNMQTTDAIFFVKWGWLGIMTLYEGDVLYVIARMLLLAWSIMGSLIWIFVMSNF